MAATPQSLLTEGACFNCYGASMVQSMELALLNRYAAAASGGGGGSGIGSIDGVGSPVGVVTPDDEQFYRDSTAPALWQATGATNQDWILWFGYDAGAVAALCTEATLIFDADSPKVLQQAVVVDDFIVVVGAIGLGTDGFIRTSVDGVTWVTQTFAEPAPDSRLWGVAYGNSTYVAVGSRRLVITSPDAVTWTVQAALGVGLTTQVISVAFGAGLFAALVNDGTDCTIHSSPDGVTWTLRQTAAAQSLEYVMFASGIFVAVGAFDSIWTSPDGITWTKQIVPTSGQVFQDAAFGNDAWIVTMDAAAPDQILRSTDNGVTWLSVTVPDQMMGIAYGNGLFVMQTDSTNEIYTSDDYGLTWDLTALTAGDSGLVRYYQDCTFLVSEP